MLTVTKEDGFVKELNICNYLTNHFNKVNLNTDTVLESYQVFKDYLKRISLNSYNKELLLNQSISNHLKREGYTKNINGKLFLDRENIPCDLLLDILLNTDILIEFKGYLIYIDITSISFSNYTDFTEKYIFSKLVKTYYRKELLSILTRKLGYKQYFWFLFNYDIEINPIDMFTREIEEIDMIRNYPTSTLLPLESRNKLVHIRSNIFNKVSSDLHWGFYKIPDFRYHY